MMIWIHKRETVVGPGHIMGVILKPFWFLEIAFEILDKLPQISLKNLVLFFKVSEDVAN